MYESSMSDTYHHVRREDSVHPVVTSTLGVRRRWRVGYTQKIAGMNSTPVTSFWNDDRHRGGWQQAARASADVC